MSCDMHLVSHEFIPQHSVAHSSKPSGMIMFILSLFNHHSLLAPPTHSCSSTQSTNQSQYNLSTNIPLAPIKKNLFF